MRTNGMMNKELKSPCLFITKPVDWEEGEEEEKKLQFVSSLNEIEKQELQGVKNEKKRVIKKKKKENVSRLNVVGLPVEEK